MIKASGARADNTINSMKHVCFISSAFSRDDALIVIRQGRSLVSSGFQVTYLLCDDLTDEVVNGINYVSTGRRAKNGIDRLINNPKRLKEKLKTINADIYQVSSPETFRVGFWLKRQGKKVIFNLREWYPTYYSSHFNNKWARRIVQTIIEMYLRYGFKKFDAVINCMLTKSDFIRNHYPCRLIEDVTNYPVVNHDFSLSYEEYSSRKPVICYFGMIYPNSCQEEMLEALIDFPDVTYLLAGLFMYDSQKNTLMQKEAWKQVSFINGFKREELPDILNQSVIANVVRDFSKTASPNGSLAVLKIFESMEAGLPVILPAVPLYESIMEKYNCGVCVRPHSVEDFKSAITYLLTHKKEAYEMGQNGRRAVLQEFSWDSQYEKYLSVINKTIKI